MKESIIERNQRLGIDEKIERLFFMNDRRENNDAEI